MYPNRLRSVEDGTIIYSTFIVTLSAGLMEVFRLYSGKARATAQPLAKASFFSQTIYKIYIIYKSCSKNQLVNFMFIILTTMLLSTPETLFSTKRVMACALIIFKIKYRY